MSKKSKSKQMRLSPGRDRGSARRRRGPLFVGIGLGLLWIASAGLGEWSLRAKASADLASRTQALETRATMIEALVNAESGAQSTELKRMRTDLRAEGLWKEVGASRVGAAAKQRAELDERRITALLRRALEDHADLSTLELVVAGHDGLSSIGVFRTQDGVAVQELDSEQREGVAKALWYADEVSLAVSSSGRRVERGEIAFEAPSAGMALDADSSEASLERPITRIAIALHAPGELVQGVLVGAIDRSARAVELSQLAEAGTSASLIDPQGRPLDPFDRSEAERARLTQLAGQFFVSAEGGAAMDVQRSEGRLVLIRPIVAQGGDGVAEALAVLEVDAPLEGRAAWAASPWLILFALVGPISGLGFGLMRLGAGGEGGRTNATEKGLPIHADAVSRVSAIELASEQIMIREWLADVRGCLEREAAKRGLEFDLRCDKNVPASFEADPSWLGGLLVALGREALDATADEGIRLEIVEDAGETLRCEMSAGETSLCPVAGMREVAGAMGARFEEVEQGRLALVLPAAFA